MRAALISLGSTSSLWTHEAMLKYFDHVDHLNIKEIEVNLGKEGVVLHKGEPLKQYDCIYAKGSFRFVPLLSSIASVLKGKVYMPLQDHSFMTGHDKVRTHLKLQEYNIPMPTTYIASMENAKDLLERISYPIVMKFPSGTQGKGVMFADSFSSASSMLDALHIIKKQFLIQEYIRCNNTDIRAIVIGDEIIAAVKRTSKVGEKRANTHMGSTAESISLDNYTKKLVLQSAKAIGAEVCGVDILESEQGPLVIEVNVSPGLQGITEHTGVQVADHIAKYLAQQTKEFIIQRDKNKDQTRLTNGNPQQHKVL